MVPYIINEYAKEIYEQNVERGWWDDPDRCVLHAAANTAARHLVLTTQVCELAMSLDLSLAPTPPAYCSTIETILELSRIEEYDLWGAVDEKLAYNKTRADHDRATTNGKRY